MSSLSLSRIPRLYQFALLAVLVVAALWFLVLRNMVSSSSSETPAPAVHPPTNVHRLAPPPTRAPGAHHAAAASAPATHAQAPAASPTHAPAGASAKHAAASAKSQSAGAAEHKPASATQAPAATATHAGATTHAPAASTAKPGAPATAGAGTAKGTGVTGSSTPIVNTIDAQLAANQIVLVLFWQPGSTTDQFVQRELVAAGHLFGNHVALHEALAGQVTEFGTYTQKALINETPTIMMITPAKAETTLPGYTTSASIAQAIEEAGGKRANAPAPSHHAATSHK